MQRSMHPRTLVRVILHRIVRCLPFAAQRMPNTAQRCHNRIWHCIEHLITIEARNELIQLRIRSHA
jgi:hypothetical protein